MSTDRLSALRSSVLRNNTFENVCFNLTNKTLYKSFPFPWTVSTVHVIVGSIYCLVCYALGFKKASFGRPITGEELKKISGPASMHAFGHIAANLSFAAVAISLTHTVKTLEPVFNVAMSKLVLGTSTPVPVALSLLPWPPRRARGRRCSRC